MLLPLDRPFPFAPRAVNWDGLASQTMYAAVPDPSAGGKGRLRLTTTVSRAEVLTTNTVTLATRVTCSHVTNCWTNCHRSGRPVTRPIATASKYIRQHSRAVYVRMVVVVCIA